MSTKAREVIIAPIAVQKMHSSHPTDEELDAIKTVLKELGTKPDIGYKIAFLDLYRVDVGRFRIHYSIEANRIGVSFIGVY